MAQSELARRVEEAKLAKCAICGQGKDDHADKMHAFTTLKNDLRDAPKPERDSRPEFRQALGVDIALRLALVEAGVIDAEQIVAAERKLGFGPRMDVLGQPAEATPASGE